MSEKQTTTIATGDKWGDPISPERQAELQGFLDRWGAETDHAQTAGPFDPSGCSTEEQANLHLTGSDVFWLVEQSQRHKNGVLLRSLERVNQQSERPQAGALVLPLQGANLTDADLAGADITGADLTGADLTGADLTGATLTSTLLVNATLTGATLTGANLTREFLLSATLTAATLTGATLIGAFLTSADLTNADLTSADLTGATLSIADLTGANLTGANLTGANLTEANLTGANLTGANLRAATLTLATLTHAILTRASLTAANVYYAKGIRLFSMYHILQFAAITVAGALALLLWMLLDVGIHWTTQLPWLSGTAGVLLTAGALALLQVRGGNAELAQRNFENIRRFVRTNVLALFLFLAGVSHMYQALFLWFGGFTSATPDYQAWLAYQGGWFLDILLFNVFDVFNLPVSPIHPDALWSRAVVFAVNLVLVVVVLQAALRSYSDIQSWRLRIRGGS
jgi:uncharacterized protein YjbI with pentapeptide repeats